VAGCRLVPADNEATPATEVIMGFLGNLFGPKSKATPVHVDDSNFRAEVVTHDGPLILDIWGPGCAPCQRMVPVLQALARQYDGKVKICELNAAEAPRSAQRLNVRGTPTVVVYRNRAEIGRVVGWRPKGFFDDMIEAEFKDDLAATPPSTDAADETQPTPAPAAARGKDNKQISKKALKKQQKKARQKSRVAD